MTQPYNRSFLGYGGAIAAGTTAVTGGPTVSKGNGLPIPVPNGFDVRAYVYNNGSFTTLSAPFGSTKYYASSINNSGHVVGIYFGAPNGFLYDNGTYTSLPPYLLGYNQITGINDRGQIVGSTYMFNLPNGFVYQNGVFTAVSNPLGVNGTAVTGINNRGQI